MCPDPSIRNEVIEYASPSRAGAGHRRSQTVVFLSVLVPALFIISRLLRSLEFSQSDPPAILSGARLICLLGIPAVAFVLIVLCLFYGEQLSGLSQLLACLAVLLTFFGIIAALAGGFAFVFPWLG